MSLKSVKFTVGSNLVSALKNYQDKNGLTQQQLAQKLGISEAMVSYLYSGKKQVGLGTIRGIMQIRELIPDALRYLMEAQD